MTELASDGTFASDLCLDWNLPLKMNGRTVILQASRKIPSIIKSVLDRNAVDPKEVPVYLMHQANQNLIDRVAETLGVASARFFSNIRHYGNTSSASIPIALDEVWRAGRIKRGDCVVLTAFGSGFTWASAVLRW